MNTESLYNIFRQFPTVTTDSRNIPANSIFFALKGETFNGNQFAEEALRKGAAFAVVDEPAYQKINDRIIRVENVLRMLQDLARFHRRQLGLPILSITGTNGKTTTKELVAAVLSRKFKTSFTQGNLNNHIGVPLTLLSMTPETEFGVVEMGANHPGEIDQLCRIAEPDFGLITNIGKAHLEGFGSFEGVIQTKTEMYRFLQEKNGKCFVNANNPILMEHSKTMDRITYGQATSNFLAGELAASDFQVTAKALFPKGWLFLKSKLIGGYNAENILAAACIGKYFGVDPLQIQEAIASYTPSNNRSQLIRKEKNTIIMDAYNANPTSMSASLNNFSLIRQNNKCVILGDMLELGEASAEEHQKIADLVSGLDLENIFLVGKNFTGVQVAEKTKKFESVELLYDYLIKQPMENSLILIKGSRGICLEKILNLL
jgi:UDP-N-acetylmuramoyl-tripeptide--D-alanyl-D-alanine ligase